MALPDATKQKISRALAGRPKSAKTRAAMAASKLANREFEPERWQQIYDTKLAEIEAVEKIRAAMKEDNE